MEGLHEIIDRLKHSVHFSSKNSFANLHNLQGFEQTVIVWLESALLLNPPKDISLSLSDLKDFFSGFDVKNTEEKKTILLKTEKKISDIIGYIQEKRITSSPEVFSPETIQSDLKNSVQYLKGVGPKRAKLLEKLNIKTIEDALLFLPMRYEDRSNIKKISQLEQGTLQTFCGQILASGILQTRRRKRIYEVAIGDKTGIVRAKWFQFNEQYMKKKYQLNQHVIVSGTINYKGLQKDIYHPEIELLDDDEKDDFSSIGRIVPVYHTTEGLHQKTLRNIIKAVVDSYADLAEEILPEYLIEKEHLIPIARAINLAHYPEKGTSIDDLNFFKSAAQRRLIFEELFLLELGLVMKKSKVKVEKKQICYEYKQDELNSFVKTLPFSLTEAQKSSAKDILDDLMKPYPMNRLLQGDVGSGKTVVAIIAMILVLKNNHQCAVMAPTEILAEQHYVNIVRFLKQANIEEIALLTGSTKQKDRKTIIEKVKSGETKILIGTHALIQSDIVFQSLGLAVIDEQHKFGVMQRATLKNKGYQSDVLVMTATPIPRTLAMTVYGDLDLSVIDELPAGRKPIKTYIYYEKRKMDAYSLLNKEIKKGRQGYIVFPLVEESEKLDLKAAKNMIEYFKTEVFQEFRLALLHGRMKADEKEKTMKSFYRGEIDILISTTVVEVGVDVPNASVMIIEHAERFGLSQLHQLRGRIGRGGYNSYCVLMPGYAISADGKKRLSVMKNSTDGFYISEKDLEIRGPGEFLGIRQSGLPELRLANIIRDAKTLEFARKKAFEIIGTDPKLSEKKNEPLKNALKKWKERFDLVDVG